MKKYLFLGIDVGSEHHACVLLDAQKNQLWQETVPNSHEGCQIVVECVKDYQKQGFEVWVGAEGCNGYASPLDLMLCAIDCCYMNVNPLQLKRYRELTCLQADKTDELDALLLADYVQFCLSRGEAKAMVPRDEYFRGLKILGRMAQQTIEHKVKMQNEFVSAIRPVWPEIVDGKTFFSRTDSAGLLALTSQYPTPHDVKKAGLANIKKLLRQACGRSQDELAKRLVDHAKSISPLQKANPCSASIIKTMSRNLTRQVESVKDMEKQMEAQLQDHPFGQWLLEQEGIGPRTAALFMGEAGDLSRYPGEAQLARVSGNGAVRCQSGKSQEKHYDGHRYNHRLKRVLIIMAQSRSQHHALSREFKKKRLDRGIKYWKVMKQLARYILRFLWKSWGKVMDNLGVNSTCAENFC